MKSRQAHLFPEKRPDVRVVRQDKSFSVDCPELKWWFAVPELGEEKQWAIYDGPDWSLTSVTAMKVTGPAQVHNIAGVEIDVSEWESKTGWRPSPWTMYARLIEDRVGWLAVLDRTKREMVLRTFLDDGFDIEWGEHQRYIQDLGGHETDVICLEEGDSQGIVGLGAYVVAIDDARFPCLRVPDIGEGPSEHGTLMEAFLNSSGRTVLCRRYNGRLWGRKTNDTRPSWDAQLPAAARITINGVSYVHWYDCITDLALVERSAPIGKQS